MPVVTTLIAPNNIGDILAIDAGGNLIIENYDEATHEFIIQEVAKTGAGYSDTPITLATFSAYGASPAGRLIIDAQGNLIGAASGSGSNGYIYEIANTGAGYASTAVTLSTFNTINGSGPVTDLISDAAGDLFGVANGLSSGLGANVFELPKNNSGYAAAIQLVTFPVVNGDVIPVGGVVADGAGNLFGVTEKGGVNNEGTVFEVAKTSTGFASTPTTLVSFNSTTGDFPNIENLPTSGLFIDAAGNLFGMTSQGGSNNEGTIFEIVKTGSSYASSATVLYNIVFHSTGGFDQLFGIDTAGNLFGTVGGGGPDNEGYVFELSKTASGYSSTPLIVASLDYNNMPGSFGAVYPTDALLTGNGDIFGLATEESLFEITGASPASSVGIPISTPIASLSGTTVGMYPAAGLIVDNAGNLFGTTATGGVDNDGTVFEIAKTSSGYASTPSILFSLNGTDGTNTESGLISDASGNLFGIASNGGPDNHGTVFEIVKTSAGNASPLAVLVDFGAVDGFYPYNSLIVDSAGNLFGTTAGGGANGSGTVFEIPLTGGSYATAPVTLASFAAGSRANGIVADASGDFFGTTLGGGTTGGGTVFEIAKTSGGYVSTPIILANFSNATGTSPRANLAIDGNGDLFGTTSEGGPNGSGVVFEIAKTSAGYSSTPSILVSLSLPAVIGSSSALIIDAAGNLFGATAGNGTANNGPIGRGEVYEIAKTTSGYVSTPTVLLDFDGVQGDGSLAQLTADAQGNLFGTEAGSQQSTVFEVSNTGFRVRPTIAGTIAGQSVTDQATIFPFSDIVIGDGNANQTETVTVTLSASANGSLSNLGGGNYNASTGIYTDTGTAAAVTSALKGLVFTPTVNQVPTGQSVSTTFTITDVDTVSITVTDSTTSVIDKAALAISGTVANQSITDQVTILPFSHTTVADAIAGQTETLTVTLAAAADGTLSNLGGGSYDAGTGVYSDTGTAAAVTSALDGLVFTPTPHQVATGQTVTTNFSIVDTDTAGIVATDSTTSVVVTADFVSGNGGSLYTPGPGLNSYTGNGGTDHGTVVFNGPESAYTIANNGDGSVTITDSVPTRNGVTHLANIEYLDFTNGTEIVSGADNSQIALLYSAAFGRQPDVDGLNFWENTFATGLTAAAIHTPEIDLAETTATVLGTSIATYFVNSPEFQQRYGALDDIGFVTQLYHNVLGRIPDAGGLAFWLNVMENGDASGVHWTRGMVLVGFSSSAENIADSSWLHMT